MWACHGTERVRAGENLSDEQLLEAGISPELIRLSIGLEDADDIIEDLRQALGV